MSIQKKLLLCILISVISLFFTGIFFLRAGAEEAEELLLPGSREEYLPLNSPPGASFSENAFAISDGNLLYVYDKALGEYSRYTHFGTTGESCEISAVAFTFDGKLFFSDSETHLYRFDLSKHTAELLEDLPCASFTISADTLYFSAVAATGTSLYAVPHNNPAFESATKIGELGQSGVPCLFADGGKLYCAVDSLVHIFERDANGFSETQQLLAGTSPVNGLKALCTFGGVFYFADETGLFRSDGERAEAIVSDSGIRSLSVFQSNLYVTSSGVREAALGSDGSLKFTGYEISGSSASFNRLSGAREIARGGDLVVCADVGNARVLVWDRKTNEFLSLMCGAAQSVATDGDLIAVGAENRLLLYRKGEREPFYTANAGEAVKGVAVICGKCYYATETSFCEGWEGGASRTSGIACSALASDLLGNLYAADAQGIVTRYREEEFAHGEGTRLDFTLPMGFCALRADFEGNLYCLLGKSLYRNGVVFCSAPEAFGDEPVSLALEERENAILFCYPNYVFRAERDVPVLDNLSVSNLTERVFSVPAVGELSVLSVTNDILGISVDLSSLKASSEFGFLEIRRISGTTGVLLGRTQQYVLCALYEDYAYSAYLLPADRVKESAPEREEPKTAAQFTLVETKLLGYPCLLAPLEREILPRAYPVTVLNVLNMEGEAFGFAYVETADGVRGYLPTNLLSAVEPIEREQREYRIGYLKESKDGVVFRTDSGETATVHDRKKIKIYSEEDGRYMVTFEENSTTYTAQVTGAMIESGSTNMIRISIIIVLCVIAVGLCAVYVILIRPKKKRE